MADQVQICNVALRHLGKARIANITDNTPSAKACKEHYDPVRRALLEEHPWNFAMKWATLTVMTGQTNDKWDYVYTWPSDCIVPREIFNSADEGVYIPYEVGISADRDRRVIMSNEEEPTLIYTANVDMVPLFTPLFCSAFSLALAAAMAIELTADTAIERRIQTAYAIIIEKARTSDARVGPVAHDTDSGFVEARL